MVSGQVAKQGVVAGSRACLSFSVRSASSAVLAAKDAGSSAENGHRRRVLASLFGMPGIQRPGYASAALLICPRYS